MTGSRSRRRPKAWVGDVLDAAVSDFIASHNIGLAKLTQAAEQNGVSLTRVQEAVRRHVAILYRAEAWGNAVVFSVRAGDRRLHQGSGRARLLRHRRAEYREVHHRACAPTEEQLEAFFSKRQAAQSGEEAPEPRITRHAAYAWSGWVSSVRTWWRPLNRTTRRCANSGAPAASRCRPTSSAARCPGRCGRPTLRASSRRRGRRSPSPFVPN